MPPTSKSTKQILTELWELLREYARQETVDPLKTLGRYLGFAAPGALLFGLGLFLLSLGGVRALQTETDVFTDSEWWLFEDFTFAPYLIVSILLGGVSLLVGSRLARATRKEEL